jgi:hypothetical protein
LAAEAIAAYIEAENWKLDDEIQVEIKDIDEGPGV